MEGNHAERTHLGMHCLTEKKTELLIEETTRKICIYGRSNTDLRSDPQEKRQGSHDTYEGHTIPEEEILTQETKT